MKDRLKWSKLFQHSSHPKMRIHISSETGRQLYFQFLEALGSHTRNSALKTAMLERSHGGVLDKSSYCTRSSRLSHGNTNQVSERSWPTHQPPLPLVVHNLLISINSTWRRFFQLNSAEFPHPQNCET